MTWIIALRVEGDAEGDVVWDMRTTDLHQVTSPHLSLSVPLLLGLTIPPSFSLAAEYGRERGREVGCPGGRPSRRCLGDMLPA